MATTTVVKFMRKTAEDSQLRDQLEALLGVGDGDISTEDALDEEELAVLKGDRAPVVAEFAAQYGYEFSADDLVTVVDALEKHHSGALSDKVFTEIVGTKVPRTLNSSQRFLKYLSRTYLGY